MIVKHVAMTSAKKSDFAGLITYLTCSQGKTERVGHVRVTNCHSEQARFAILEVINTQLLNTRALSDKTYHVIVSFRPGEEPNEPTLQAIEDRLCAALGFGDHQRVSVVHHDTDNLHVHVAINKIHPKRHTMHEPFNAYHTFGQLCPLLEAEFHLEKDNHRPEKVASENRTSDMERHADVESLLGWIKRECSDKISRARSWEELHQIMREHGLRIHERAKGLVITSGTDVSVKASSVSREFSRNRLEARLGRFHAAPESQCKAEPRKCYAKRPARLRADTVELFARYQADQTLAFAARTKAMQASRARKNRLIEDAKRTGRLKRQVIKSVRAPAAEKRLLYALTSKNLREGIGAIADEYRRECDEINAHYRRKAWADWLRSEATSGDQQALAALRAREGSINSDGNNLGGVNGAGKCVSDREFDSITKRGTIIYRTDQGAIRDDGTKLTPSTGIGMDGLVTALQMAVKRYGARICVNGSETFMGEVVQAAVAANLPVIFDDPSLEVRRKRLARAAATTTTSKAHGNNKSSAQTTAAQAHTYPSQAMSQGQAAAEKYIAEREEKRVAGIDIPKHIRYPIAANGKANFAGIRHVDGQPLALLKRGNEIIVVPLSSALAGSFARIAIGQQVNVTAAGINKTKGWSR
jgi:hypothetical protein